MIQSASLSRSAAAPGPSAPDLPGRGVGASGRFTQSLAAFLDAGDAPAPVKSTAGKGKEAAADGSALPDERNERDDEALAWLLTMTPPPIPVPPVAGGPVIVPDTGNAAPGSMSAPRVALGDIEGQVAPVGFGVAQPEGKVDGSIALAPGPIRTMTAETSGDPAVPSVARDPEPEAKRVGRIAVTVGDTALATAPPSRPVIAAQVFGAAMREATAREGKSARSDGDIAPLSPPSAPVEAQRHAVAASGETQQAPLDMGHDRWPHRMIERIESMRDAADAADTRIRLVPDALGAIDVSMRREGDAVHVHFAAEQAATRALLTDAQPRLTELAEARGIRLGGSAVDSGGADARQNRAPSPTPLPQAPARIPAEPTTDDDARIA